MIHAPAFGATTAAILGRRHACRLTPAGVRRSAAGPACWPAQRSGSPRWGPSLVSGGSPQSPCITATRHARAMAHPHFGSYLRQWRCERLRYWHPNVTCRRRFGSCWSPIDQEASSAGRSAVAETWLRITAGTPGARAHRRRPADRAQAFPAGRTALPSGLVPDGPRRPRSAVDGSRRGMNHTARCQPRISPVPPLAPCCSQTPSNASSRTDPTAFMNPESPARADQRRSPRSR